jgi:hypothetical protein
MRSVRLGLRWGAGRYSILGMELMPWQQRVLDGQLLFDGDGDFLHRMSMVSTARQNGKTVALTALGRLVAN